MKRYLWVGGLVLAINAYSADNPFDLAKNMQKIEAEDTFLLDTLEDEAKSIKKDDIKSDDFVVAKPKVEVPTKEQDEIDVDTSSSNTDGVVAEDTSIAEEQKQEDTQVVAQPEPKVESKDMSQQEKKLEAIVDAQEEIDTTPAILEDKVVEENVTKTPTEEKPKDVKQPKENVEVVQITKEIVEQSTSNDMQDINETEQQTPIKTQDTKQEEVIDTQKDIKPDSNVSQTTKQPIKEDAKVQKQSDDTTQNENNTEEVVSIEDINITKEKEEMAKRVQRELEEAIKDVDRED